MTKPGKAKQRLEQQPVPPEPEEQLKKGSQDATSPRAKNAGHKKVTADKWNQ
jgi:hypothetical protein